MHSGFCGISILAVMVGIVSAAPAMAQVKSSSTDSGGPVTNGLPGCGNGDVPPDHYYGPPPPARTQFATSPGGVEMHAGSLALENTDLSIGDANGGLSLDRTFAYDDRFSSSIKQPFGMFFTSNWDMFVREHRDPVPGSCNPGQWDYIETANFGQLGETFRSAYSPIAFKQTAPSGYAEFVRYAFTARDGTVVVFNTPTLSCGGVDNCGYATSVKRPDGTKFTLEYDTGNSRLRSVTSNRGYALLFEYGTNGYVSKACVINLTAMAKPTTNNCPAGVPTTTYGYTGSVLSTATMPTGDSWGYSANLTAKTFAVTKPGASSPYVTNTYILDKGTMDTQSIFSVSSQAFATGESYSYTWNAIANTNLNDGTWSVTPAGGKWTDGNGKSGTVTYGTYTKQPDNGMYGDLNLYVTPGPVLVEDQIGRKTLSNYCGFTTTTGFCPYLVIPPLQSITDPEGGSESYTYGTYRNVTVVTKHPKPGSGLPSYAETRTFPGSTPATWARPASVQDAGGNTTSYTYDATTGQPLTETKPAVQVNGTGSAVAPTTAYTYTLRKAWISNGSGGYVQSLDGISLPATQKTCRTTAMVSGSCAGGVSDEVVTAYDYGPDSGPNNLWLRGMTVTADVGGTSTTYRTCYGYDPQGNRTFETKPRAGLTQCQ